MKHFLLTRKCPVMEKIAMQFPLRWQNCMSRSINWSQYHKYLVSQKYKKKKSSCSINFSSYLKKIKTMSAEESRISLWGKKRIITAKEIYLFCIFSDAQNFNNRSSSQTDIAINGLIITYLLFAETFL